jgi:hypothetical protein
VLQDGEGERAGVWQRIPDVFVGLDPALTPGVAAEPGGNLEDRELAGPGGEAGLAPEVGELPENRQRGVAGGLVAGSSTSSAPFRQAGAASRGLGAESRGGAGVQARDSLPRRSIGAEIAQPGRRVLIELWDGHGPIMAAGTPGRQYRRRYCSS